MAKSEFTVVLSDGRAVLKGTGRTQMGDLKGEDTVVIRDLMRKDHCAGCPVPNGVCSHVQSITTQGILKQQGDRNVPGDLCPMAKGRKRFVIDLI